ncbi:MAG TPA: hypothetical protein VMW24_17755 [Sedimentisphaerales bacterium]|nr:hypothetical protein [Sedimentisphaerales bacterium]
MRRSLTRNIGYAISLCLFAAAMLVLHRELRHYHYRDIVAELRQVKPAFLVLAAFLTVLDYLVLTLYDALALRYIQRRLEWSKIALASFVGYVFSHNMTIVGGSTARYRIYSALGVVGKWSSAVTPHVLAAVSLAAGAILLFSGAWPATKGRMRWLDDLLPLPAIELSHFLGSLAGAGLLILARGLQRRVDAAYHLTVALLGPERSSHCSKVLITRRPSF